MSEKSLQINISSVDDAKSVVANLQSIKAAYEAHNCTSVELCIAEEVVTPSAKILMGMVPWCVTYRKIMKVQAGNVLFLLPHYPLAKAVAAEPELPDAPKRRMRRKPDYLLNSASADFPETPRQVSPLVPATSGVT